MQRLPFVTYRGQTNRIIYLHENTRNERLMQKKTPITDPLCRSVQCLRPFLIVRPKTLTRDSQNGNLWGEPFHQCESPDPLVAPGRGVVLSILFIDFRENASCGLVLVNNRLIVECSSSDYKHFY